MIKIKKTNLRIFITTLIVFNLLLSPLVPIFAEENPEATTTGTEGSTGNEGETGQTGETPQETNEPPTPEEGETVIDTGDVNGGINVENNANTTEITDDTQTEETGPCGETCEGGNDAQINLNNENDAGVDTSGSITGNTGENEVSSNYELSEITTGNINILSNVVNFINTNLIGSGWNFVIDIANGFSDDLDISSLIWNPISGRLVISNENNAQANNSFSIVGNTGDNTAQSNGGNVVIDTGDINIATNIVNVVNTNIVNSQFLLTIINIWNDWSGDIVLPSQRLDVTISEVPNVVINNAENTNDASLVNDVSIIGDSGDNTTRTIHDATASVKTGEVVVANNIVNQVNTNLINEQWLNATVNIFGNWVGYVLGLDEQAEYNETNYQVMISLSRAGDPLPSSGSFLSITNSNNASVVNEVDINANTGGNTAEGGRNVSITTGNIAALTNIFNIINTNIVGGQWILALVNVFGNWTGDLAFGRPDLILTERVEAPDKLRYPGDRIGVTLQYTNVGDSPATDVTLSDDYDNNVEVVDSNGGRDIGGSVEWFIPRINPGETKEVSYTIAIADDVPFGQSTVTNNAIISAHEKDRNYDNNVATASFSITRIHPSVGPGSGNGFIGTPLYNQNTISSFWPAFTIKKQHFATTSIVNAGDQVKYQIRIKNTGSGDAPEAVVLDDLVDPKGNIVNAQGWDLGKVYVKEEIILDYTIEIKPWAINGTYKNYAQVFFTNNFGDRLSSIKVSTEILVVGGVDAAVSAGGSDENVTPVISDANTLEVENINVERIAPPQEETFAGALPALAAEEESPIVLGATYSETNARGIILWLIILIALIFASAWAFIYIIERQNRT